MSHEWAALPTMTLTSATVESCFERAKEFVPERWYSKPEMIKNKNAYAPFALGPPYPLISVFRTNTNNGVQAAIVASVKPWRCRS